MRFVLEHGGTVLFEIRLLEPDYEDGPASFLTTDTTISVEAEPAAEERFGFRPSA